VKISSGKLHVPRKIIWKNLLPVTTYFGYDILEYVNFGKIVSVRLSFPFELGATRKFMQGYRPENDKPSVVAKDVINLLHSGLSNSGGKMR
jgi:hypothetical protein